MKILHSQSENTYNIIHDNGVQTSVKINPSGSFDSNNTARDKPVLVDKNKYTVIVSSSLGCPMSCTFCHLTKLGKPFGQLSPDVVVENVLEAIAAVYEVDPTIATKYIKLCYMGEGEALLDMDSTTSSSLAIVEQVLAKGYAAGIDGVDISTCMPNIPSKMLTKVVLLEKEFESLNYRLNPYNHSEPNRSIVRLFYSLHHYDELKRSILIPNSKSIATTLALLSLVQDNGVNVVVHYMFMDGVNDSIVDLNKLVKFINENILFQSCEFRVLRYNSFDKQVDGESKRIANIIYKLENTLDVGKLKIQFSAGEDVKAACGMFI